MDVSSDEETDRPSMLKLERERKKKERTKRDMLSSALLVPELVPNSESKRRANPESIDSLERLIKQDAMIEEKAQNLVDPFTEP